MLKSRIRRNRDIPTPTDSRPRPKLWTPLMGGGPADAAPISRANREL